MRIRSGVGPEARAGGGVASFVSFVSLASCVSFVSCAGFVACAGFAVRAGLDVFSGCALFSGLVAATGARAFAFFGALAPAAAFSFAFVGGNAAGGAGACGVDGAVGVRGAAGLAAAGGGGTGDAAAATAAGLGTGGAGAGETRGGTDAGDDDNEDDEDDDDEGAGGGVDDFFSDGDLKRAITSTLLCSHAASHPVTTHERRAPRFAFCAERLIQFMNVSRPPRNPRTDPRDILELRALAERQPELTAAVALQIDLVDALRRIQTRVATTSLLLPVNEVAERIAGGKHLLDFDRLPIDWSELRLLFRQITDILRRHDALDGIGAARLHDVGRSPALPDLARQWFADGRSDPAIEMLDEVLAWSMRPFLVRSADVLQQQSAFSSWKRGICPVCAGEPDFACITTTGDRLLICGRCQTRWPTEQYSCPFCGEQDKQRITSFATPDGAYRVTACQTCLRYVKAFDGRRAGRPVMPAVDAIATLPLDAVVMQRGFTNG